MDLWLGQNGMKQTNENDWVDGRKEWTVRVGQQEECCGWQRTCLDRSKRGQKLKQSLWQGEERIRRKKIQFMITIAVITAAAILTLAPLPSN